MSYKNNRTAMVSPSELTLDAIRSKLSGLHFAKEMLSDGEREILSLAESLVSIIDSDATEIDFAAL